MMMLIISFYEPRKPGNVKFALVPPHVLLCVTSCSFLGNYNDNIFTVHISKESKHTQILLCIPDPIYVVCYIERLFIYYLVFR